VKVKAFLLSDGVTLLVEQGALCRMVNPPQSKLPSNEPADRVEALRSWAREIETAAAQLDEEIRERDAKRRP
jgi:hypothetical protein